MGIPNNHVQTLKEAASVGAPGRLGDLGARVGATE